MTIVLARGDREFRADIQPDGEGYVVTLDGRGIRVEGRLGSTTRARLDGRPVEATVRRDGPHIRVELAGRTYVFRERGARAPKLARRQADEDLTRGEIHAPMPGLIVEVLVREGETVEVGQPLVVVEAMKMQNALAATVKGRVTAVAVAAGAAVETGQLLVAVRPEEA